MDSQETFAQLQLRFTDPIQYDYEVIRPVVLFAQGVTERSRETETARTTVGEKARRFVTAGMLGLVDQRTQSSSDRYREYPEPIANYILYLKHLYPPIRYREVVRILARKFGYQTNYHTVKRFLERHPVTVQLELGLERFHEFEDVYQARWTVVRLYIARRPLEGRSRPGQVSQGAPAVPRRAGLPCLYTCRPGHVTMPPTNLEV